MSKRFDVATAILAGIRTALPDSDVVGLDGQAAIPQRPAPGGRVVLRTGDPGEPEVDLSPLTYHYEHPFGVELIAPPVGAETAAMVIDQMAGAIGAWVLANRTLGGLCDWLESTAAVTDDVFTEAATPAGSGIFEIVASYSTTDPLN